MHFYVDESGQTGLNLFDESQPFLYYGVLRSKLNLDVLAEKDLKPLRRRLGVDRLHAAELGNGRLVEIVNDLNKIKKKYNLGFDFCRVAKVDHALINFFDQVFDQGMNPAVPWNAYWTPLRYVLLIKVAYLFDEDILKKAWEARISPNDSKANELLIEVCETILSRVPAIPDARSREILTDSLSWAINNVEAISYNVDTKKDTLQISPNLVGFQSVMHGIASRLEKCNGLIKPDTFLSYIIQNTEVKNVQKTTIIIYSRATSRLCEVDGRRRLQLQTSHGNIRSKPNGS